MASEFTGNKRKETIQNEHNNDNGNKYCYIIIHWFSKFNKLQCHENNGLSVLDILKSFSQHFINQYDHKLSYVPLHNFFDIQNIVVMPKTRVECSASETFVGDLFFLKKHFCFVSSKKVIIKAGPVSRTLIHHSFTGTSNSMKNQS